MATLKYEVMCANGKYNDRDGNEKVRWLKCGVVLETDKGMSIKLECLPVSGFDGWLKLFEPKPKDGERAQKPSAKPGATATTAPEDTDDIPFN